MLIVAAGMAAARLVAPDRFRENNVIPPPHAHKWRAWIAVRGKAVQGSRVGKLRPGIAMSNLKADFLTP